MSTLSELGTYLASELGMTRGTNLFENFMPETPDTCLALFETGGMAADLGFGNTTGVEYEHPQVAVWVRGAANDSATPRATAHLARQALAKVQATSLSGTLYHLIIPMQSPFILERDNNRRVVIVFNCQIDKVAS